MANRVSKGAFGSLVGWLWDWAIEHSAQIIFVVGSGMMTYLASAANWINQYGSVAWGVIGIFSYVILNLGYMAYASARSMLFNSRFAEERAKAGGVNPLAGHFVRQRINLTDFYHPFFKPISNARFEKCELYGPASIVISGCTLKGQFTHCEAVILSPKPNLQVVGAMLFQNCIFEDCDFYRVTFFMPKDGYLNFKSQVAGDMLPVIADGAGVTSIDR